MDAGTILTRTRRIFRMDGAECSGAAFPTQAYCCIKAAAIAHRGPKTISKAPAANRCLPPRGRAEPLPARPQVPLRSPPRDFLEVRSTLTLKEAAMETMSAYEAEVREVGYPAARPAPPRRVSAATIVAGLYILLVLGAPLIVRYGPDFAAPSASAAVAVHETVALRCAPEHGSACKGGDAKLNEPHRE